MTITGPSARRWDAGAAIQRRARLRASAETGLGRKLPGRRVHLHGRDVEHVGDEVVVGVEGLARVRRRPSVVERFRRWAYLDICVDERSAAVARALDHEDVVQGPDVVGPAVMPMHAVVADGVARELARRVAATALQHSDVHARLREAARRHGAAEP